MCVRQPVRRTGGVRWRGMTGILQSHRLRKDIRLHNVLILVQKTDWERERESSFRLCELSPGQENRLDPQLCLLNNTAEILNVI